MKNYLHRSVVNATYKSPLPHLDYSACFPIAVIPVIISKFVLLPFLNCHDTHKTQGSIAD